MGESNMSRYSELEPFLSVGFTDAVGFGHACSPGLADELSEEELFRIHATTRENGTEDLFKRSSVVLVKGGLDPTENSLVGNADLSNLGVSAGFIV